MLIVNKKNMKIKTMIKVIKKKINGGLQTTKAKNASNACKVSIQCKPKSQYDTNMKIETGICNIASSDLFYFHIFMAMTQESNAFAYLFLTSSLLNNFLQIFLNQLEYVVFSMLISKNCNKIFN